MRVNDVITVGSESSQLPTIPERQNFEDFFNASIRFKVDLLCGTILLELMYVM